MAIYGKKNPEIDIVNYFNLKKITNLFLFNWKQFINQDIDSTYMSVPKENFKIESKYKFFHH